MFSRFHSNIAPASGRFIVMIFGARPRESHFFKKKYLRCFTCYSISDSYTMGCPPVRGDNPRALACGLSHVQVDIHCITIFVFPDHTHSLFLWYNYFIPLT